MIATFARKQSVSVSIIDANAEYLTPEETAARIADIDPLLTAIVVYGHNPSASTQTMPAAGAICSAIKRAAPQLKTIMVGGHAAALPKHTLEEGQSDFVCGGEGPHTVVDLVEALRTGREDELNKVRGLWYWDGGKPRSTAPAPLVKDLDQDMPELAWDLLPMDTYRAHNWHCFDGLQRQPYAAVYTTLGCPYHCSFCCIQAPFKEGEKALGFKPQVNSYRFWNPQIVIAQIDKLVNEYGVRNLKIADEMFVLNPRHVNEICDLITQRGYDLNIWAYSRVDSIREEMVDRLRRAGFSLLSFGIEAGNPRVRESVDKGFDQEKIFETLGRVSAAGVNVGGNYIFGLPEDDMDSMQATLDLALELNAEWANFYCTMAYPGSALYDLAVRNGWALPEDWGGYSQYSAKTLPLPTNYLSASEVLRFRDRAFQTYYTNPKYLAMVGQKFGAQTLEHIREMTSHTLLRENV
jgi:radical SAM superfamily enzyme YgiQ (UPF0313 family)